MTTDEILNELEIMFPNAHCELVHVNPFELAVAVALSAQTTDVAVNKVTPALFEKYPNPKLMAEASVKEIEEYIKKLGLFRNKAKNLKGMATVLVEEFDSVVPNTMEELLRLPGIGRKSANVILSVAYHIPAIAVDTHVERVSKRLGLAYKNDDVYTVEKKLNKKIKKERWNEAHHLFIFFGRYKCKSYRPDCNNCPFIHICKYQKQKQSQ
ncbi:MAG: endonuclease III [Erysipelotrichaceae bacterium]|nr:endonuclease III [Erysipelotrichaceae bacterium]